jgi:hypothetical protein
MPTSAQHPVRDGTNVWMSSVANPCNEMTATHAHHARRPTGSKYVQTVKIA